MSGPPHEHDPSPHGDDDAPTTTATTTTTTTAADAAETVIPKSVSSESIASTSTTSSTVSVGDTTPADNNNNNNNNSGSSSSTTSPPNKSLMINTRKRVSSSSSSSFKPSLVMSSSPIIAAIAEAIAMEPDSSLPSPAFVVTVSAPSTPDVPTKPAATVEQQQPIPPALAAAREAQSIGHGRSVSHTGVTGRSAPSSAAAPSGPRFPSSGINQRLSGSTSGQHKPLHARSRPSSPGVGTDVFPPPMATPPSFQHVRSNSRGTASPVSLADAAVQRPQNRTGSPAPAPVVVPVVTLSAAPSSGSPPHPAAPSWSSSFNDSNPSAATEEEQAQPAPLHHPPTPKANKTATAAAIADEDSPASSIPGLDTMFSVDPLRQTFSRVFKRMGGSGATASAQESPVPSEADRDSPASFLPHPHSSTSRSASPVPQSVSPTPFTVAKNFFSIASSKVTGRRRASIDASAYSLATVKASEMLLSMQKPLPPRPGEDAAAPAASASSSSTSQQRSTTTPATSDDTSASAQSSEDIDDENLKRSLSKSNNMRRSSSERWSHRGSGSSLGSKSESIPPLAKAESTSSLSDLPSSSSTATDEKSSTLQRLQTKKHNILRLAKLATRRKGVDASVLKVVLLGDASSGKTSLINSYIDATFSETYVPTRGVSIQSMRLVDAANEDGNADASDLIVEFWEGTGPSTNPNASHIGQLMFSKCNCVVIAFDLTLGSDAWMESVPKWCKYVQANSETARIFLMGTKNDVFSKQAFDAKVSVTVAARKLASSLQAPLTFTAAANSQAVIDTVHEILLTAGPVQ